MDCRSFAERFRFPTSALSTKPVKVKWLASTLARGDDPEEVIRRITDYRATDKHDPAYYARHTVTKAQADLLRIATPDEGVRMRRAETDGQEQERSNIP